MPLRMLLYASGVYSDYVDKKELDPYSSSLQKIPAPRMVVFYNGDRFFKDKVVMKLSDAFIDGHKGDMEVEVTMLNINYGSNRELMKKCRPLCDYSKFIADVRKYKPEGENLTEAIRLAIEDLPDDSPIKNYLLSLEVNMISKWLTAEYSVPRHEKHLREEGRKEGLKEGRIEGHVEGYAEGIAETARRMLADGKLSPTEVAKYTGLTLEEVQKLATDN